MLSRNIQYRGPAKLSPFRKIAISTWKTAADPSVYSALEVDIEPALRYLEKIRTQTQAKITLTHVVGRIFAEMLKRHPELNCILRWNKLYIRKNVDIFFQVASDSAGEDLSGATVRNADQKSVLQIAEEMQQSVVKIRDKKKGPFKKMKGMVKLLPSFATALVIKFGEIFNIVLNLWTPLMGVPKDPFGSMMLTNIGSLGLDMAFAPLVPYSRVPLVVALGAIKDVPVVKNDQVVPGRVVTICATFDHRLIDGMQASKMVKTLYAAFEDPERELGQ